jgi:hypothetical protein
MPAFALIPAPLEAYTGQFNEFFMRPSRRAVFRQYLPALLLPFERNKTLTALANTQPVGGALGSAAPRLQCFLSEST